MLNIQHLTKTYSGKKAVDDLSLHIAPGEIYGFIGHNGAGKTTTLRSVVGILQFDAGEITIGGRSIRTDPIACKRELAYIPDNPDLYDYMTGIRYLNFIADIFDVSAEVRGQRIHDYAARFELTDDLAQPIASYSHGMKQKLAIISAWLHHPRLIIMDEPFVGLDPKAAHLLKGMMREFCDAGGAIFFSTHVLEVAEKLCDKVAIIRGGKLIRSGTMEEVKGDDSLEAADGDLPCLPLRRQEEPGPLQGGHRGLPRILRFHHGGYHRRDVHRPVPCHVPEHGRGRHELVLFRHHGPYGHPAGCLRQRVHHLFQPLPAQGQ